MWSNLSAGWRTRWGASGKMRRLGFGSDVSQCTRQFLPTLPITEHPNECASVETEVRLAGTSVDHVCTVESSTEPGFDSCTLYLCLSGGGSPEPWLCGWEGTGCVSHRPSTGECTAASYVPAKKM